MSSFSLLLYHRRKAKIIQGCSQGCNCRYAFGQVSWDFTTSLLGYCRCSKETSITIWSNTTTSYKSITYNNSSLYCICPIHSSNTSPTSIITTVYWVCTCVPICPTFCCWVANVNIVSITNTSNLTDSPASSICTLKCVDMTSRPIKVERGRRLSRAVSEGDCLSRSRC